MFYGCTNLETLDASNWNTSSLASTWNMFYNCSNLRTIDFGALDTSNVTKTTCMFMKDSKLSKIYVSDNPDFSKATRSDGMFDNCRSLKGYLGTTYNANYVDKTRAHIDEGSSNPGYFSIRK